MIANFPLRLNLFDRFALLLLFRRWGGIVIANPPSEICEDVENVELVEVAPNEATVMGVFIAQLRLLLGIPETVKIHR